jgi:hypothetical protein
VGSKLRRLRVQAGVTGASYQAQQRADARRARSTKAAPASCTSCGSAVPDPRRMLCGECASRLARASVPIAPSWVYDEARKDHERRTRLAHTLGSHELAKELADAIHAAALAAAHASVHPNQEVIDDVWEQALAELRRGVPASELTAVRARQLSAEDVRSERASRDRRDEVLGQPFEAEAIDLKIGGQSVPQGAEQPAPRAPGMRRRSAPAMGAILAMALLLGGGEPPRGSR